MKAGDYVRTINGIIGKIESKRDYTTGDYTGGENDFFLNVNHSYQDYDRIVKSSPNIIDLIEAGDYVNGYLIDYIDSERRFLRSERPYREDSTMYKDLIEKGRNYNQCLHFFAEDIKSIVTREMFESMEYKVKE